MKMVEVQNIIWNSSDCLRRETVREKGYNKWLGKRIRISGLAERLQILGLAEGVNLKKRGVIISTPYIYCSQVNN